MIQFTEGDILTADVEALVNTVNCVGVMGRGIALQFRTRFPENYKVYKKSCECKEVMPGKMLVFEMRALTNPRYIINFPTKRHWKEKSQMKDIKSGLQALITEITTRGIKSIAIPPLGCGLGGLNWDQVKPLIVSTFDELQDVKVYIFEPSKIIFKSGALLTRKTPEMTVGRATLIGLMEHYLMAAMDPILSLLEIHKLMYFMQEAGENLRLQYKKAPYGPYAENLRHVLNHIEGHFISGYDDVDDRPTKQIQLKIESIPDAQDFLKHHPDTSFRFDRVVDLIEGFETSYDMELLATVHWVVTRENAHTVEDAIIKLNEWNDRKKMFKPEEIKVAWETLVQKNWIVSTSRM